MNIIALIRYRFFLFAGIFPYLLGQVMAFGLNRSFHWQYFWWGFAGIFLVLIGVELFNEYFDAKSGGDRVFELEPPKIPEHFFILGIIVFLLAFLIGLYLSFKIGWPIVIFAALGFLGAYFYVGPPLRWAYRGLGELVIAGCYGPLMLLGSYYLQTARIEFVPFWASLVCAFLIFSLAISNEIPDYIQDKLVGKKNIVVRLGKQKALKILKLSLIAAFVVLGFGIYWKMFSVYGILAIMMLPLVLNKISLAQADLDNPRSFYPAIKMIIVTYLIVVSFLGIGYLGGL